MKNFLNWTVKNLSDGKLTLKVFEPQSLLKTRDIGMFTSIKALYMAAKGDFYIKSGRYKEAIEYYDKVIKIYQFKLHPNPKLWSICNHKGVAFVNLGKHEKALECFDKALKLNPHEEAVLNNKGNALYKLGRYEEAIECLDKALKLNPKLGEAWLNKGIALDNSGKHKEAIKCYVKAIEINPKYRRYLESRNLETISA